MKPLHASVKRLSHCPCCQSKFSYRGMNKTNIGKTVARMKAKRDIKKELEA